MRVCICVCVCVCPWCAYRCLLCARTELQAQARSGDYGFGVGCGRCFPSSSGDHEARVNSKAGY